MGVLRKSFIFISSSFPLFDLTIKFATRQRPTMMLRTQPLLNSCQCKQVLYPAATDHKSQGCFTIVQAHRYRQYTTARSPCQSRHTVHPRRPASSSYIIASTRLFPTCRGVISSKTSRTAGGACAIAQATSISTIVGSPGWWSASAKAA